MTDELKFNKMAMADLVKKQTVPFEGDEIVRCSPLLKDGKIIDCLDENVKTLHDVFLRGLKESDNGPCLGWRPGPDQPYSWITYQEVLDRAQHFGSGLIAEGAQTNPDQFIGIFSQNRIEWKVAEQACNSFSMVVVTLYDTLGPEAIRHIVNQCELKFIVVDTNAKAKRLMEDHKNEHLKLDTIISMEAPSEEVTKLMEETNVKVKTFSGIEELGKENLKDFVPPKPDDLHTICYTSGTTGLPKGVMLTHLNIVADYSGIMSFSALTDSRGGMVCGSPADALLLTVYHQGATSGAMGAEAPLSHDYLGYGKNDTYISYLPLAHIFERLMAVTMYYVGGKIGFFQGNVKLLTNDIAALKPSVFAWVPRLINRIYDKVWQGASASFIKSFLLKKATNSKVAKLDRGITGTDTIWDKIVFKKIRETLGGNVKYCITGAAPISLEVISFMRASLGVPFPEGYGQTESSAGICLTLPGDYKSGSVGTPALCNYVKLVDVPEKNYFAKDGKGEICAKGHNIFKGYYKDEEKTKEALDEDGWLHTGDVGMWLPNGSLKIIDRKKHIFKLALGEYIAPEKIEGLLVLSAAVSQVFIYGESLKSTLVAIVVPDPENFESWCSSKGVNGKFEELLADGKVNKLVLDDMCAVGKEGGLKTFELPKKIFMTGELFSVENEMLTPTFKTRRPQITKRYKTELDQMYETLD